MYPRTEQSVFDELYILTPTSKQDPIFIEVIGSHPDLSNKTELTDILDTDLLEELLNRQNDGKNIAVFLDEFAAEIGQKTNVIRKSSL